MGKRVTATNRDEWRGWLERHHATTEEVWLVFYKKHTGKASVTYREALEDALCFGWIDGVRKRIDEQRYCQRFTPRRDDSRWSPLNIRLARELIDAGRMTPAGKKAFERRREYEPEALEARAATEIQLPKGLESTLKKYPKAWINLTNMAPGYRKRYIAWLSSAKRPDTRQRRLEEAIRALEAGEKPGMK